MKKYFVSFVAMVLVILTIAPGVVLAQANPAVTSFKIDKSFGAGAAFTVTVGNVDDFAKLNPTMTLNQIPLTVSGVAKNVINGTFPKGVPAEGGTIHIRFKGQDVTYELRVPLITGAVVSEIAAGNTVNINGKNFSETDCAVTVGTRTITPNVCHNNQIIFTVDKNFTGGDLTVKSNGFISAVYPFPFTPPHIDFIDSATSIRPEAVVRIHGSGFLAAMSKNTVYDGSQLLTLLPNGSTTSLLNVQLPKTAVKSFKVVSNGIESNTLNVDISISPTLNSYQQTSQSNKTILTLSGNNFNPDMSKDTVGCGGKTANVTYASVNSLTAGMANPFESGCLTVTVDGKASNCLAYKNTNPITLTGFSDPVFVDEKGNYTWTLFTGGQLPSKPSDVAVYVSGSKVDTTALFAGSINVTLQNPPDKGDVYFTAANMQSNKLYYNFGSRFYPSIKSVTAPGGFAAGQPVNIQGNNFGRQSYSNSLSLSVSGVGLSKDDKGNLEWTVTPMLISTRLDDKVKGGEDVTVKVSFKNKTSNEIHFKADKSLKEALRSPWIYQLRYPEGMAVGKTIRVEGGGFSADLTGNQVLFEQAQGKVTKATENALEVVVPSGIKEKGKLKVVTSGKESNTVDYVMALSPSPLLAFRFGPLADKTPLVPDKETSVAQLIVNNALGPLLIKKLRLDVVYSAKDLTNAPPFGEFKLSLQGGSSSFAPAAIERNGSGYAVYFSDLYIPPNSQDQIMDLKTTVRGTVSDGTSFSFKFNPQDSSALQAFNLDGKVSNAKVDVNQKPITSDTLTIRANLTSCIDTDPKNSHCPAPKK